MPARGYTATMKVVGIEEIKDRLGEYVRLLPAGEDVLLTDRGEVVAEIRRADRSPLANERAAGLAALAARGGVVLGAKNEAELYPQLARLTEAQSALALLAEERGDG